MANDSRRRASIFREVGLESDDSLPSPQPGSVRKERPQSVRFRSKDEIHVFEQYHDDDHAPVAERDHFQRAEHTSTVPPARVSQSPLPSFANTTMYRIGVCVLLIAAAVPLLPRGFIEGHRSALPIQGVSGGPIPEKAVSPKVFDLDKRADTPTDWCFKWAQQSAIVNGTLYLYGGEATTEDGQTSNTWNNDFLTIDLTKDWQISTPSLTGLPRPSGPPDVALGYLWNSYDSLYLYGGQFSWKPPVEPEPFSLWEYDIADSSWTEHSNPETSSGKSATDEGEPVQRSAEGAGVSVPSLGRGFYFGGHLDAYTTPGWDVSVWRLYLQSLLEYTFPGYANPQVSSLSGDDTAGSDGVYRNITNAGLQDTAGFTRRADGLLIYVPGFGDQGILLALAGGTNTTFTQMNVLNVYDIAKSSWYLQSTSGPTPKIRVNPCAVVAAAADGSSYNIYMFGGQNLIPAGNQTQFNDMWILSLPTFTWIQVDQGGQSLPDGRSGHTCNVWDAQMVMVGGYTGGQLSCEYPATYVFDLSNLQWVQQFTALSANAKDASDNPLNQQGNQKASGGDPGGLEGSYGYQVPDAVISVIGGDKDGHATITTPIQTATAGPLKTGSPVTYTITGSNGATITETAIGGSKGGSTSSDDDGSGGPNIAAIVVGVICGLLFLLICYLLFCLFLYRKQLALYKRHVEMTQRQAAGEKPPAIPGLWTSDSAKTSSERPKPPAGLFASSNGEGSSHVGSHGASQAGSGGQTSSNTAAGGYSSVRRSSDESSTESDLLGGREPTFVGVMLHPRRSLRVTNRD
ncbi:uncharacterized protein LTR77_006370 [Saxophila tyrrhenica]|uniref:Kelch repeat-containing protein n=1 Tax=Saxophila tyrrhenica TaxID=1690608 RepID=A0AAV9P7X7_9PEZI|nr:hypothetical protein LTR77_006370 [Saxophila tyrrhenica]